MGVAPPTGSVFCEKSQPSDDSASWKKPTSRKHWIIRGRVPPNTGASPADTQAFVSEGVHVAARVAAQLRPLRDFDVAQVGPCANGAGDLVHDLVIVGHTFCPAGPVWFVWPMF